MRKLLLRMLAAGARDLGMKQKISQALEYLPDAAGIVAIAATYSWWMDDWWPGFPIGALSAFCGYITVVLMGDLIPGFSWLMQRGRGQQQAN
jgi:hypothetical protein